MPSTPIVSPGARGARSHPLQRNHSWQSRPITSSVVRRRVFLETGRPRVRIARWPSSCTERTEQIRISRVQSGKETIEDSDQTRSVGRHVVVRRHRLRGLDLCVVSLPQRSPNAVRLFPSGSSVADSSGIMEYIDGKLQEPPADAERTLGRWLSANPRGRVDYGSEEQNLRFIQTFLHKDPDSRRTAVEALEDPLFRSATDLYQRQDSHEIVRNPSLISTPPNDGTAAERLGPFGGEGRAFDA